MHSAVALFIHGMSYFDEKELGTLILAMHRVQWV